MSHDGATSIIILVIAGLVVCISLLVRGKSITAHPSSPNPTPMKWRDWFILSSIAYFLCALFVDINSLRDGRMRLDTGVSAFPYVNLLSIADVLYFVAILVATLRAVSLSGIFSFRQRDITSSLIEARVDDLWHSPKFLSCLQTALPKGENNAKYGLDYVPYMLQNIEFRRARYQRSSFFFLCLTVIFSLVFSVVVVVFGYIIVNDTAAGLPKSLRNLEGLLATAVRDSRLLAVDFQRSDYYTSAIGVHLDKLDKVSPNAEQKPLLWEVYT